MVQLAWPITDESNLQHFSGKEALKLSERLSWTSHLGDFASQLKGEDKHRDNILSSAHWELIEDFLRPPERLICIKVPRDWCNALGGCASSREHLREEFVWTADVFKRALSQCCNVMHDHSSELIKSLQMLCKDGHLQEALELIATQAPHVAPDAYRCLLQTCINRKDLEIGRKVQTLIRRSGYESNPLLGSHLVRLFDACGRVLEAKEAFSDVPNPNVFAWSAVISACTKHGQGEQALEFYQRMQESRVQPDAHTFVAGLKACAMQGALILGMLVHAQIFEKGFDSLLYVGNALIDMYCKCGNVQEARRVFNNQLERDIVTWNAMLAGYALNLKAQEAFEIFICMYQKGNADTITYVNLLKLCSNIGAVIEGNLTFFIIIEKDLEQEEFVVSTGIDMFAKCGCLDDAYCLFEKSLNYDVVTWNALIAGISQYDGVEHGYKTLEVFQKMMYYNYMLPDSTTYACVLKACSSIGSLAQTKFVFTCIIERGFATDKLVLNALITTYARCGCPSDAYKTFHNMSKRDAVTWNAMIAGYARHGLLHEAFQLMQELQQAGRTPDTVSWNSLIAGYSQHGYGWKALAIFKQMQQEGFLPDRYTFVSIFNACASVGALPLCRLFHLHMLECNLLSDTYVINSLIDMYAKCGSIKMAHNVFNISSKQQVVTWNALVAGYSQHGHHVVAYELVQQMKRQPCKPDIITWNAMFAGLVSNENVHEAFRLYSEMVSGGMQPDNATLVSMVKGCSLTGSLNMGELFYAHAASSSFETNTALCNACIEMYALCGRLKEALLLFERLRKRDRITWNTIIAAFALHNNVKLSFTYFEGMQREGVKPDIVTFTSLLSACGHLGLLNEANLSMESMNHIHKVSPTMEHINCVVDILGRAGHLSEAESMLTSVLPYTNVVGWTALLNNCRTYGNVEIGSRCFGHMIGVDDGLHPVLIFMSNVLAEAEFLDEVGGDKHLTSTIRERYLPAVIHEKLRRRSLQLKTSGYQKAT